MAQPRPSPIARLLPSMTDLLFLLPLGIIFGVMGGAVSLLGDGDTGWHVRTGEWILRHGSIPHQDIFSYTKPGQPWFAWEWLWDVIFAWLHDRWGMQAVVLVSILVVSVTALLVFRLVRRQCGNTLIAAGISFLATAAESIHWLARPHLFSLLFLVIFYAILERVKEGRPRLLLWLPPLTVLWTNLHGGFIVGIVLTATYAGGEWISAALAPEHGARRAALGRSRPYLLTAGASLAASLINPYFYHLHAHIVSYLTDPYQHEHITEFLSMNFHHPAALYFEAMMLLSAVAAFWDLTRGRYTYPLMTLGSMHLALVAARNVPIFAILAAPVIARDLREWVDLLQDAPVAGWLRKLAEGLRTSAAEFDLVDSVPRLHAVSLAAAALLVAVFYAPAPPDRFKAQYDPKRYPELALSTIRSIRDCKGLFTDDEWGDYLIYRLYPDGFKVFIDGRSDFYGADFSLKFLDVMGVKFDWEEQLRKYGVDTILLSVSAPLAGTLKESKHWRPVYDDGVSIIFRPVGERPAPLLSAAPGSQPILPPPTGRGKNRDRTITSSKHCDPQDHNNLATKENAA